MAYLFNSRGNSVSKLDNIIKVGQDSITICLERLSEYLTNFNVEVESIEVEQTSQPYSTMRFCTVLVEINNVNLNVTDLNELQNDLDCSEYVEASVIKGVILTIIFSSEMELD